MSETTTTETTTEPNQPEVTPTEGDAPENLEDAMKSNENHKAAREAAKYRQRAQEAEAERDGLRESTAGLQKIILDAALTGEIQLLAPSCELVVSESGEWSKGADGPVKPWGTTKLRDPGDFYQHTGLAPADLVNDDGLPDAEKLAEALGELHTSKPYLFQPTTRTVIPGEGGGTPPKAGPSWEGAFKSPNRR